jgi:hypothetical protein
MIKTLDIGIDFHHRLTNRDSHQSDGKFNAVQFRERYLKDLDSNDAWENADIFIELDFSNVTKIGPSFANEAFAYFTKYARPPRILEKIYFKNIKEVFRMIIEEEIEAGYRKK